jgi:hypothetical protein
LGGYRIQITAEQLRSAPSLSGGRGQDWPDRESEQDLHDYYRVSYYWLVPWPFWQASDRGIPFPVLSEDRA